LALVVLVLIAASIAAAAAPEATTGIRISAANQVPACVTPERLGAFLAARNPELDPRFRDIAHWYRKHGAAWRVRWDYAFFQMMLETGGLSFQRGDGRRGDVDPRQNNFAGLGTTGRGVPGDSFPNVSSGVLAHIHHLVVYSGERVADPVAPRTELKQDDILASVRPILLRRPMTFQDLTGRWATDRSYGRSIETIAERFRELYCSGDTMIELAGRTRTPADLSGSRPPAPVAATRARPAAAPREQLAALARAAVQAPSAGPAAPSASPGRCRIQAASYGGRKTLLIRTVMAEEELFTALGVLEGFERSMAESFIRSYAPGGTPIAEFPTREAALARAYELCPSPGGP
jgi:hypothetical protein